jgi:hypothetical protein
MVIARPALAFITCLTAGVLRRAAIAPRRAVGKP